MMITDAKIKELFLECNNKDPNGLYADDVDLLEFGRKLEAVAREEAMIEERDTCIKFVRSLNSEVAKALEDWRKWQDRSQ